MKIKTIGSVCSGIGAAAYAWKDKDWNFQWFAEIEEFQSNVLKHHYPEVPNLGDMLNIPTLLKNSKIPEVDLLCGGTPCQSFSLAGLKKGLNDERGNLTLEFLKAVEENDKIRLQKGKKRGFVLWENVEGVLSDKTNAFGIFLAGLAGYDEEIPNVSIGKAGILKGPKRNVAWRTLDSKFFGLPQQRKRVFVLASDREFHPENVLLEEKVNEFIDYPKTNLTFTKDGVNYEVFREYTDTLYSAYGTKWNGNSAAYNGSLFVVEDEKIRRLSPLECERLMGFPDNYTDIKVKSASRTKRYQSLGNSWSIPVVKWIGDRLENNNLRDDYLSHKLLNTSIQPNDIKIGSMIDIVSPCSIKQIFLSPVGAAGILRRSNERKIALNPRLEIILEKTAEKMSPEEIEKLSLRQKRGAFSKEQEKRSGKTVQLTLL